MKTLLRLTIASFGLAMLSVSAQTPPTLGLQLYAGLTITGAVGTVYSVEYVTDLTQTNNPSAWQCLEYLQLPASPPLFAIMDRASRAPYLEVQTVSGQPGLDYFRAVRLGIRRDDK